MPCILGPDDREMEQKCRASVQPRNTNSLLFGTSMLENSKCLFVLPQFLSLEYIKLILGPSFISNPSLTSLQPPE